MGARGYSIFPSPPPPLPLSPSPLLSLLISPIPQFLLCQVSQWDRIIIVYQYSICSFRDAMAVRAAALLLFCCPPC